MPRPDDRPGVPDPTPGGAVTVDARGNGHGEADRRPLPAAPRRRPPGPSTKPALVVLGLTVFLFLLGATLEAVSGHQSRPTPVPTSIATARGAVLRAVPARPLLTAIVSVGQPPDDLLDALAVPRGSAPVAGSTTDRGVELYDRSLRMEVAATQQDVIAFFRAQLPAQHWRRLSQGPDSNGPGYLILEQHPASDGHEWEIGVTVAPTVFGGTPSATSTAGAGASSTGTTAFTLRLFAVSDQN